LICAGTTVFVAIRQADRQARFDDTTLMLADELRPGSVRDLGRRWNEIELHA
jgi:hypothetical protein